MIGDHIEVTVLWISRDRVRLGIAAPREIPVFGRRSTRDHASPATGGSSRAQVDEALKRLTDNP
jgi:sRNA-binding carbon storage regulator CsrA